MTLAEQFQKYLAAGELHIQHCNSCGADNLYQRSHCTSCHSRDLAWRKASGRGTLVSFTVVRSGAPSEFQADVPYGLGVVRLSEGPQLLTRLYPDSDGDFGTYKCDMPMAFAPASAKEIARRPVAWFKKA